MKRTLAGGAVTLGLATVLLVGTSSAGLRALARLPGLPGRSALGALVRRGDGAGTRRALALLADGAADPRDRAAAARAFGARRAPSALPALLAALNGGPSEVAAACSRALRAFDEAGRSFEEDDPPEQCAGVVREWNAWWRLRGSTLLGREGAGAVPGDPGGGLVAPLGAAR
ncbi:MAG TPA: hypothetical protein VFI25_19625 [Planctomycetota bacterium]|jgi:hypothetical protein|nr:hypothetical protein [Planctomycetota bacterium]